MRFIGILAVATLSAWAMPVADNVAADVNGVVNAAADVLAKAEASVANVGVKNSNVGDNIGNNNHVDVLPRDLVTVGALIEALANALAKADVSLKAVLANVQVQDSSILTNILNDNKITVLRRRDGVTLPANIDAIVEAFINAAVAAGADVQAAVANIGINYSTLLSNIGNNNVVFVRRGLPEIVDIAALVNAIADACAKVGVDAKALIANINIDNSSVLTDILNGNKVIVARDGVILPANIDVLVEALINALVAAGVDVQAAVANIGINYSTLLSNIGNNNVVFVRRGLPEIVDIAALLKAFADAAAKVGVDINAVIANLNIQNSSILTDILNGNKVIVARDGVILPANIDAIVLALINAAVAAGVNVQAAIANIGIDYSTLLSNIGNNNVVFVRRGLPEIVDIAALIKAIADACAKVGVDINALIANINIENSSILTDILNGNKVIVGKRDLGLPLITADVLAVLKAIVEASLDAQIDVFATALNAGLNCATILSNILNNNSVTILPIFLRRAAALDVYSTVLALVQALIGVGVPVDVFALNAFIKNSNIATNILNDNIIKILSI